MVTKEEASAIEETEYTKAQPEPDPMDTQTILPGIEPPALPIPSGSDIRAARKAAGISLRDFARMMKGPAFKTWQKYEIGQIRRAKSITPDIWQRVRDFIAQHGPKTLRSEAGKGDA